MGSRRFDTGGRHVFKLYCDRLNPTGEAAHGVKIVVRGSNFDIGNLPGRRIGLRGKRMDAIAHLARGDGEHPAQLAAAENADGRAWKYGIHAMGHGNFC
jgi:hypothetical protein